MAQSYLGVLTTRGLERLEEESEHAARFLIRRCYREAPRWTALCWATFEPQAAETIRQLTRCGLYRAALWRFERCAIEWGCVPPPGEDGHAA